LFCIYFNDGTLTYACDFVGQGDGGGGCVDG